MKKEFEQIFELMLTCDENNFKLAYRLSQPYEDFSLKLINQFCREQAIIKRYIDINRIKSYYRILSKTYSNNISNHYTNDDADKYYMERVKHLGFIYKSAFQHFGHGSIELNLHYEGWNIRQHITIDHHAIVGETITCSVLGNEHQLSTTHDDLLSELSNLKYLIEEANKLTLTKDYRKLTETKIKNLVEYRNWLGASDDFLSYGSELDSAIRKVKFIQQLDNCNEWPLVFDKAGDLTYGENGHITIYKYNKDKKTCKVEIVRSYGSITNKTIEYKNRNVDLLFEHMPNSYIHLK